MAEQDKQNPIETESGAEPNAKSAGIFSSLTIDNKYEIKEKLGEGASAAVYKVLDILLNRYLAVKILHSHMNVDQKSKDRFMQEALLAASLDHPNIVKIYSRGILEESGQLYLVMDLLEGKLLSTMFENEGKLSISDFFSIFEQCLDGLSYAHKQGLVHRDIKPENIMILSDGQELHVKLLDFGLAKNVEVSSQNLAKTAAGELLGSSSYMSPEQCVGTAVDARSDLYSLACVMFESLSGSAPFAGENDLDTMYKQVHKQISRSHRFARISPSMREFLNRALKKEPKERFQNADEMKQALQSIKELGNLRARTPYKGIVLAGTAIVLAIPAFFMAGSRNTPIDPDEKILANITGPSGLKWLFDDANLSTERQIALAEKWIEKHQKSQILRTKKDLAKQLEQKKYRLAAAHFYKSAIPHSQDNTEKAALYIDAARAANDALDLEDAIASFESAEKLGNNDQRANAQLGIARYYESRGEMTPALKYARLSMQNARKDACTYAGASLLVMTKLLDQGKFTELENELKSFKETCESREYPKRDWKIQMLIMQYKLAASRNDIAGAHRFLDEAGSIRSSYHTQLDISKAILYIKEMKYAEAKTILDELTQIEPEKLGLVPCLELHAQLCSLYLQMKMPEMALADCRKSISIWTTKFPEQVLDARAYLSAKTNLLMPALSLCFVLNKKEEFDALALQALDKISPAGYGRAAWLCSLSLSKNADQKFDLAEKYIREAIKSIEKPEAAEGDKLVQIQLNTVLVGYLIRGARLAEASALIKTLYVRLNALHQPAPLELSELKKLSADLAESRSDFAQSIVIRKEALSIFQNSGLKDATRTATLYAEFADSLNKSGKVAEAKQNYERAASILAKSKDNSPLSAALFWSRAGKCSRELGEKQNLLTYLSGVEAGINKMIEQSAANTLVFDKSQATEISDFLDYITSVDAKTAHKCATLKESLRLHSRHY